MRTTITIDDDLLKAAKALAAERGRPVGDVLDDALRVLFASRAASASRPGVVFPTFGGSGLRPGVDLADKEAVAELLDQGDVPHAAG